MSRLVGRLTLCVLVLAAGFALVRALPADAGPKLPDTVVLPASGAATSQAATPQHLAAVLPELTGLLVLTVVGAVATQARRPSAATPWDGERGRGPPAATH